jgi:WD40 repeat protein
MTQFLARLFTAAFVSCALAGAAGQSVSKACPAPPAVLASTQPNIFSEQQEQWLGDAMADQVERFYKPVRDPAENEYLAQIAKRLLAALPPTTIQFRVILVDSDEVNGFSLAGGRVYLTRKLVANAKNEDEVASVIGHEMGHILSHQFAIETTADLKRLLGVTSVSDEADIYAKFQKLVDARMTDKHRGPGGNSDEKQDEADAVSVYAIAAAGYRPQAYAEFWDRMFFVDGKVGGALSDFFGTTKPEEKRLRAILKLVNALPPGCGASQPTTSPEFERWHTAVVANQGAALEANVKPVASVALTPPLRMDLERLRFSRDGKYVLAQDETSISVLSRDPYKQLFRFDALGALPADFSPDSQRIVFHTTGLHTEEWSVAEQKLLTAHEPVAKRECVQSKLSPDGRTLFCTSLATEMGEVLVFDLNMLDSATGDVLFQKKTFFEPSYGFFMELMATRMLGLPSDLIPSSFSRDGNVLLIGPSSDKLAFDLRTRQPISIGGGLKAGIDGPYAFLGDDKIVGVSRNNVKDSGVFSFPEGKRLQAVPFGLTDLEPVTQGDYVLSHNIENFAVGLADVDAAKFVVASKSRSMDVWGGWLLNENADGSVVLHKIDKMSPDVTTTLAISPLSQTIFAVASDDRRYLAISTRTRGGVWDLSTGERVLLARSFSGAAFGTDDSLYVEFPKFEKQDRAIVHFEFAPFSATPVAYKEDETMRLARGPLQEWKKGDKKAVELVMHDVRNNSVLWRQTFAEGAPAHSLGLVPDQMVLVFRLKSDFAKEQLDANPALAAQAQAIAKRDTAGLLQVVDERTGKVLHELALDVPLDYEGLQGVQVVGELLYVTGTDNRTIVYALQTGAKLREFFGYVVAADAETGRVCVANRSGEAAVYDSGGGQLADFYMGDPLRFAAFQDTEFARAGQLVLLTADQKVRTMAVPSAAAPAEPAK